MAADLQIRPASSSDIPAINTLVNSAYRGETSRQGWTTEADYLEGQRTDPERLQEMLGRGVFLCACEDDELVGCVFLEKRDSGAAYLGMLTVQPGRQAKGLGRTLLTHAEDHARRKWGASRMVIQVVHVRDTLLAWYERRGYRKTGKTEPFPYGDERSGIPLRTGLYFEILEKTLNGPAESTE